MVNRPNGYRPHFNKKSKRSKQLFCGTCNKFEVCKDLCKETDPCCKIYKAK